VEPGFLEGIVCLAQRAEHPVGHCPQVWPVLLESLRQPLVFVPLCHNASSHSVIVVVTKGTAPM
jgi:hypothetical protein